MAADNTPGASNGHNEYKHQLSQPSRLSADGMSSSAVSMATIGAGTLGAEGLGIPARKGSKYDKKIGHYRKDSVGQVTYKKRPTSELMAAIQLGINHSVGSQNPKPMRDVLYEDFHFVETHAFPRDGSTSTPAHRWSDFRFKTYAPAAFRYFRELFRIKPDDFLCSLCTRPLTELSNPGASGSIFYITEDDEFIIKTVQHKEADFLQKLLPGYYMNLNQNPCTLLPKFYGLYCYQCSGKNIRFVIMNNILPSSIPLHEKYDLKGSTYKRKASKHEKMKKSPTLKDLDFRELHPDGLGLDTETYQALIRTIDRDCRVLQSFKIMDYSLLLAIHRIGAEVNSSLPTAPSHMDTSVRPDSYQRSMSVESQTGLVYKPRLALYSTAMEAIQAGSDTQFVGGIPAYDNKNGDRLVLHIGIIDILQSYRLAKKLEHTVKSMVHDGDSVSVHQPGFYAQRFQSFCSTFVFRKFNSANGRNSPTKRRSLLAPSGLAAASGMPNTRRKSLIPPLEAAKEKLTSSQPSNEVASLGDKPDILPRPTPPPSHSVSLLDVHTSPVSPALRKQPLSVSMHSMMSTPSHTDRTDAAMSFTASSPSLGSLNTSPIAPLTVTADINIDASENFSTTPGTEVVSYSEQADFSGKDETGETLEEETLVRDLTEITRL